MTSSVSPGISDVDTDTGSQSSVGAGVGVGVGAAVVLLVVMGVLGVGLFCVWRRRHPSKVVPPVPAAIGDMHHLENPVYGSKLVCVHTCTFYVFLFLQVKLFEAVATLLLVRQHRMESVAHAMVMS